MTGALVDGVDVDAVHAAVAGCPGVAELGGDQPGAMTTYLPGRRLPGIRVTEEGIEIEVRMTWGASADRIATDIRYALRPLAPGRRVDITIADVELPTDPPTATPSAGSDLR